MNNKKIIYIIFIFLTALTVSCSSTKYGIGKFTQISQLAVVKSELVKIVRSTDHKWYGDRKILFEVIATVKAGIDLDKLEDKDIIIKKEKITIILPQPELLELEIDPDDIEERYNEEGILRAGFSNVEKDIILTQGEKNIREKFNQSGILKMTKKHVKTFFTSCLKLQGFKQVTVKFK